MDLVDHHDVHPSLGDIPHDPLEGWTVHVGAAEAAVVVALLHDLVTRLRPDEVLLERMPAGSYMEL
jgi:hypothetical protein